MNPIYHFILELLPYLLILIPFLLLLAFLDSPEFKGWFGEKIVENRLENRLDSENYQHLHDLIIPSQYGTTQIDHIVISIYGIFVIETKNYSGWIFGNAKHSYWTQVLFKYKNRFQNPLHQNQYHIKSLASLLKLPINYFHNIVVFSGDYEFKTHLPDNVLNISKLDSYIMSYQIPLLNKQQIQNITRTLQQDTFQSTPAKKAQHIQQLKKRKNR